MQPEVTYVEWNGSWIQFCEEYRGQNVFTKGPFCLDVLPMCPNAFIHRMGEYDSTLLKDKEIFGIDLANVDVKL